MSLKKTQKQVVFSYLFKHTASNKMVHNATGIPQANICRIKRKLEKQGLLQQTEKKRCKITKSLCFYLTTNPQLFNTF